MHSDSSSSSRSVRLSWAATASGSPVSCPTARMVKRASPVSDAARAPWPATSPMTTIHPSAAANAS